MRIGTVWAKFSVDVSSFGMAFIWSRAAVVFNGTDTFDFIFGVTRNGALARTQLSGLTRSSRYANIFFFTPYLDKRSRTEKFGF